MLEWIFSEHALMNSRWGRRMWIGSKNPHPFNRQFIYLARGANVKMPWRLVFIRRMGDSPYWAQKPRGSTFMEPDTAYEHLKVGEEPAMQSRRQICGADSSSLKPGLWATEGVPDLGVPG